MPVIDKTIPGSLQSAVESPHSQTRSTAIRLIREAGAGEAFENGSAALKAYEKNLTADPAAIISAFAEAKDDWTKSALIAASQGKASEVFLAALDSDQAGELGQLVESLLPGALTNESVGDLLISVTKAPPTAAPLKAAFLDAVVKNDSLKPEMTHNRLEALATFLQLPETAPKALPLVSRWDTDGKMQPLVRKQTERLSKILADANASSEDRAAAASALVSIGSEDELASVFQIVIDPKGADDKLRLEIISILGEGGQADALASNFHMLAAPLRNAAFDEIVKQPAAALALLTGVEHGNIKAEHIGPGNISRLRSHPDKSVSERAASLSAMLNPGAKEKAATIAAFLPEARKPGNVENGKNLYSAACAICHKYDDLPSAEVGPGLTGMGTHSAEELLVHIIDPNREVDPTFWQWNITTKKGQTLAGVITSENRKSITLRNQGGETEIRKQDIAERVNTTRSFMPEGLDALGAESLRDIISYLAATDRAALAEIGDLPADSTAALGQTFAEPRKEGTLRILIAGAGSSHHFPRDFMKTDSEILSALPDTDVAATLNLKEALALLPQADVLVFSGNHAQWGTPEFQKALNAFADAGKGIVLLHAATWSHPWEGYNKRFVAGETKGHGKGKVAADSIHPANHPILKDVPETFTIQDESYHFNFFEKDGHTTLVENKPDGKTKTVHPALWIVNDPKTRIVAYTHGHDDKSHANPAFQTILKNAVQWVSDSK